MAISKKHTKKTIKKAKPIAKTTAIKKPVKKKIVIKKDYNALFNNAIIEVSGGSSILAALKGKMSTQKFYELLSENEEYAKRYARACEDRADTIADEIFEIADNKDATENEKLLIKDDNIKVQRDKLRVDSRKWILAKLHPKKYGDKIDVTSGGEKMPTPIIIFKDFSDE